MVCDWSKNWYKWSLGYLGTSGQAVFLILTLFAKNFGPQIWQKANVKFFLQITLSFFGPQKNAKKSKYQKSGLIKSS
jgi:hypothetical protein